MGKNYYFTYLRVVLKQNKKKQFIYFLQKLHLVCLEEKKKKDALWCSYSIYHRDHLI